MAELPLPQRNFGDERISDSHIAGLFGAAAMTEAQTLKLGWQPPSVESLQLLLPDYEILGFLARGGMGAVYKAVQRSLGRTVAIKILPPEVMADGDLNYAERFKQEARAMAKLKHPGIVAIHEAGETNGLLYLVMEYVNGCDVAELVRTQEKLPPELALNIAARLCAALAYAHACGVVHRDIKPSNVMVDKEGRVKVADFGLAKMIRHEGGNLTVSDMRMGTPDFIAPESLVAGLEVDQRADLYAVGVMLYQMLTGRIPRGRFELASATVQKLDQRFDAVIDKAMKTDREKRYSSALELHHDLESIRRSTTAMAPARKRMIRRVCFGVGIMAACAVLAAAVIHLKYQNSPAEVSRRGEEKARKAIANSLGMKFVPVEGASVLFCIHETRRQDYAAFAATVPDLASAWTTAHHKGFPCGTGDGEPVVAVSFDDARKFCEWLGKKEGKTYRLPTHEEWSIAAGLGTLEKDTPGNFAAATAAEQAALYPWGTDFPPKTQARPGNFGDAAWHEKFPDSPWMEGFSDGYPTTAPVMSFRPNVFGLYDMAGNAAEWCASQNGGPQISVQTRGGTFHDRDSTLLLSSYRRAAKANDRTDGTGFRCVLVPDATPAGPQAETPKPPAVPPVPLPVPKKSAAAAAGSLTNSLGMTFLPVPGTKVLFCAHETRRQDYAAFAAETPGIDRSWMTVTKDGVPAGAKDDHPVVAVSWEDAQKFCMWLTTREGRAYRLPTDEEWSIAFGLGDLEKRPPDATPAMLSSREKTMLLVGHKLPLKTEDRAGNFGDEAWHRAFPGERWIEGYDDGYPTTAPVMTFTPNRFGLFDMAGNVDEWCEDWYNAEENQRFRRGAHYKYFPPEKVYASIRLGGASTDRYSATGFRCVLVER